MDPPLTDDEERFMRWLEEGDVQGHQLSQGLDVPPHWSTLREDAEKLAGILRSHLPVSIEPPDPESFNDQVRQRLD